MNIYLADLRYNYTGFLANDCMPLGVAYMKAVLDRDLPSVRSRLFAYPDRLWEAIEQQPPDVLMLSNYLWNEALSFHIARLAKRIRPEMLVIMGGPNIPIEPERQIEYVRQHPEIDVYALGEGDFLARDLVQQFLAVDGSLRKFREQPLPSSVYWSNDGEVARQASWNRHKEIDEIPSPWLTGVLDEFFDSKLCPLMETNRGCPFTCTFCVQGTNWYTKVHNFSVDRIRAELEYVAKRIQEVCPSMGTLRIADSNYGMFERDIEISGFLGDMQKKYGWPRYIDATTGKNRADRIIQSVEKASGALVVYQAVQSLDENVLRNVKRTTIKLEAYEQILMHIRGRGLRSNTDLILGLPGESLHTHVSSIHKLLDSGVSQVTNFQLMMLKGSELDTMASRHQFRFETKFRVLPKNFGVYGGEKVFDVEEIVVATDTMSFDDYVQARKYALVSVAFFHNNDLDVALNFAHKNFAVKRSVWMEALLEAMEAPGSPIRKFIEDFVFLTKNELFASSAECVEFYSRDENFARLLAGEIGENLMHKHNALASFYLWPDICKVGMDVTKRLVLERGAAERIPDFEAFWADFHQFMELQHAWGLTSEQILAPAQAVFSWNIAEWIAGGLSPDPTPYRLPEPTKFEFRLTSEGLDGLRAALQVWTTNIQGLTKLVTRIKPVWQTRECEPMHSFQSAEYAVA